MKIFFKILAIIFLLLVIIPGDKLSFPVGLLVLLEFSDGALVALFGLSFIATILYLLISAISKYDDKVDDLTILQTYFVKSFDIDFRKHFISDFKHYNIWQL